jgi:hypothetical protein
MYSSPYYKIVNSQNNNALTLTNDTRNVGVTLSWDGSLRQQWTFERAPAAHVYTISQPNTDLCIGYDPDKSFASLSKLVDQSPLQRWILEPIPGTSYHFIRSFQHRSKVLDLSNSSSADGAPILVFQLHHGKNQQWLINHVDKTPSGDNL